MSNSFIPANKDQARRRYQQMNEPQAEPRNWQSLIEEQIAQLDLSNLPGKGKPLDLSTNPYVAPDEAMAQHLLKIDAEIEAARRKLQQAHDEYLALRDAQICAGHQWVEGAWQAALREFRQEVERINRRIRDYNLKAPSLSVHKFSLRLDEELMRLGVAE